MVKRNDKGVKRIIMKTTLIRISPTEKGMYFLGIGIGFDKDLPYGYFFGIIIEIFRWTIRIGIDRELES